MDKWIIENMRDCLRYGFSFKWFIESKDYYLENYNIDDLRQIWSKQIDRLSRL